MNNPEVDITCLNDKTEQVWVFLQKMGQAIPRRAKYIDCLCTGKGLTAVYTDDYEGNWKGRPIRWSGDSPTGEDFTREYGYFSEESGAVVLNYRNSPRAKLHGVLFLPLEYEGSYAKNHPKARLITQRVITADAVAPKEVRLPPRELAEVASEHLFAAGFHSQGFGDAICFTFDGEEGLVENWRVKWQTTAGEGINLRFLRNEVAV